MRKRHDTWLNEFTVFGAFVVVSFLGFLYLGAYVLFGSGTAADLSASSTAPTAMEYQAEVRQSMSAFLTAAGSLTVDDIASVKDELSTIVEKTQERLIAVRVPSAERDAHLSLVLLMEQWKRALAAADNDRHIAVFDQTQDYIVAHPWVVP